MSIPIYFTHSDRQGDFLEFRCEHVTYALHASFCSSILISAANRLRIDGQTVSKLENWQNLYILDRSEAYDI